MLVSCGAEVPTSFQNDALSASCDGDAAFLAACALIQAKCINCHRGEHDSWIGWSEADFVASGRVSPGDINASSMYTKLNNVPGGNMPPSDSGLSWSTTDRTVIENWINDIDP